ncbi:MAG: hypothetical protein QXF79_05785 [Ignisphaera sp.]
MGIRAPISSIYLTNIERIPLSMCCIGGTAININFIQCSYGCFYCPWESQIDARSARVINLDLEILTTALTKYKPDVVFLNGGDLWRFADDVKNILSKIKGIDVLKGVKVIACPAPKNIVDAMLDLIKNCDIVLVEIGKCYSISLIYEIVNHIDNSKHLEFVVVGKNLNEVENIVGILIEEFVTRSFYVPLNLIPNQFDENSIYSFINRVRLKYPLIHTTHSKSSEYSSILCPSCRLPVVVKQGINVINVYLDENCRCKFCKNDVVSIGRNICRARRKIKIPINIPIL